MRISMSGFTQTAGIGYLGMGDLGLGPTGTADFSWSQTFSDLLKGWTNIGAQILAPPVYSQGAGGVEIRGGAPVLATSVPGSAGGGYAGGAVPGGGYAGAGITAGDFTGGISNTSMLMIGAALLAVVVLAKR